MTFHWTCCRHSGKCSDRIAAPATWPWGQPSSRRCSPASAWRAPSWFLHSHFGLFPFVLSITLLAMQATGPTPEHPCQGSGTWHLQEFLKHHLSGNRWLGAWLLLGHFHILPGKCELSAFHGDIMNTVQSITHYAIWGRYQQQYLLPCFPLLLCICIWLQGIIV